MDERQRRIGENEILFRDVNERLKEVSEGFTVVLPTLDLVCECGDGECAERLPVSLDDYERVRARPEWFMIRPGHEAPDVEDLVEDHGEWAVVEKHEGSEAELARAHDPRT